jgi:DNA replication and repair protein RecF
MQIKSLKGGNFRNLADFELEFSPGKNLLLGMNGSGKTNLLEAIHYLCIGRSMKNAAEDDQLIGFTREWFRLEGTAGTSQGELAVEAAYNKVEKRLKINGELQQKLSELIGRMPVISLSQEDDDLCKSGPGVRRRFMDLSIAQLSKSYLADLQEYGRILKQRNHLLFSIKEGRSNATSLEAWNQQLVDCGMKLVRKRTEVIEELKELAGSRYFGIAGGRDRLGLRYHFSYKLEPGQSAEEAFAAALQNGFDYERRRGMTMFGPHRDDLEIALGGNRIRQFGSQGQQRTAAIALKLAVAEVMALRLKEKPVLLLDEIFAELDSFRSEHLVGQLDPECQVFIASAHENQVTQRDGFRRFRLEEGRISPE